VPAGLLEEPFNELKQSLTVGVRCVVTGLSKQSTIFGERD
jgi:hypothetical protein